MASAIFANLKRPQVTITENTSGVVTSGVASHSAIYLVGEANTGDYNTPVLVSNNNDFANVFGGSLSEPYVRTIFRQDDGAELYFVRVAVVPKTLLTVADAGDEVDYSLTLNGVTITYTPATNETLSDITQGLRNAIRASTESVSIKARNGDSSDEILLYPTTIDYPVVITAESNVAFAADPSTESTKVDYINTIENSFSSKDGWPQGFLLAPQAFQYLLVEDRDEVASIMESHVSGKDFDWVALVDGSEDKFTTASIIAEKSTLSSPEGHTGYYQPYLTTLEDEIIPPSPAIAGLYSKVFKRRGYQFAAAGTTFPLQGISKVNREFTIQEQDVLTENDANYVLSVRNKGTVVWGMRTVSTDPFYSILPTRVIMNVVNGSLRDSFDQFLFQPIDGQGVQLIRIKETAEQIVRNIWNDKALFGETEEAAFLVECDFDNNPNDQLGNGNILVEVYVVPTPSAERILIATYRTAIGSLDT